MIEQTSDITIAIMSFNRGAHLKNLLHSIDTHIPTARVRVFDDCSSDPETIEVLSKCNVEIVANTSVSGGRHGNLYSNMQTALDDCQSKYLLFLQDDTQVVRPVTTADLKVIEAALAREDVAFLRPQFLKAADSDRFINSNRIDETSQLLRPKKEFSEVEPGNAYCDVVICDVEKLRVIGWIFQDSEKSNQLQAQRLFANMPFLLNPFVFYCPEVPSFRERKLYCASKLVQKKRNWEVVSFSYLAGAELHHFLHRPKDSWPIAENYLETSHRDVLRPFVYQDYARTWWLHALYKVESRLWRMTSPIIKLIRR